MVRSIWFFLRSLSRCDNLSYAQNAKHCEDVTIQDKQAQESKQNTYTQCMMERYEKTDSKHECERERERKSIREHLTLENNGDSECIRCAVSVLNFADTFTCIMPSYIQLLLLYLLRQSTVSRYNHFSLH